MAALAIMVYVGLKVDTNLLALLQAGFFATNTPMRPIAIGYKI